MKTKGLRTMNLILFTCFFSIVTANAAEESPVTIEHFRKGATEAKFSLHGKSLDYNGAHKELSESIAAKYHADIAEALPESLKGDEACPDADQWKVITTKASRNFCKNEKAIAFLKKMHIKLKVMIR